MNSVAKNWLWFLALMAMILGVGLYLGGRRRDELGKSFDYSLDDYRKVDPALIKYRELEPLVPHERVGKLTALAVTGSGRVFVGGTTGAQELPGEEVVRIKDAELTCLAVDEKGFHFWGWKDWIQTATGNEWKVPSEKAYLTSIAVDDWYVYAADAGSRRIWRYDRRNPDAKPLEIGKKDWANGVRGFFIPSPFFDIAISRADGSLWAVNPGHHALENYRPDGMPLSKWEASSMMIDGFSGCCNPSHFALLPDGGFVTAEKGLPRVKIHNVDGSLRCVVAAPDRFEENAEGLDVAVDDSGKIYVLDPSRNQVRVFEEKK